MLGTQDTFRFTVAGFLPGLSLVHLSAFSRAVVRCSRTAAALNSGVFLTTGSPSPTLPTLRGLSCTSSRTPLETVAGTCHLRALYAPRGRIEDFFAASASIDGAPISCSSKYSRPALGQAYKNDVYFVPVELDEKVAKLHVLSSLSSP